MQQTTSVPGEISVWRFMGSLDDFGSFLLDTARVLGRLNFRENEENPPSPVLCRLLLRLAAGNNRGVTDKTS